jgi:hypothetical protein
MSSDLIRLSGLAAVLAGVLFAILDLVSFLVLDYEHFSEAASTGAYIVIYSLFLLAAVLLVGGLVGLYAHQSKAAGTFGFVVFVVAFLGSVLLAGAIWSQAFLAPSIAKAAPQFLDEGPAGGLLGLAYPLTFGLASLGWLLFGVASLRARVYPRVVTILLIIGGAIHFIPWNYNGVMDTFSL